MQHSKKYRLIATRLIRNLREFSDIKAAGVKIAYLSSQEEKKRNKRIIFADCNLVSDRYKWCCPYDFFIVVYEPNVLGMSEKQLEILMRHELHHIGIDFDKTETSFYVVPHDVEEFWNIIDDYGLKWSEIDGNKEAIG